MLSDPELEQDFDALLFGTPDDLDDESSFEDDLADSEPTTKPRKFGSTEDISPHDTVTMDESSCVFEPNGGSRGPSSHEVSRIDYPVLAGPEIAGDERISASVSAGGEEASLDEPAIDDVAIDGMAGSLPKVGDRIGRYRIRRELGSGAMGAVYLAEDTVLERDVALKFPNIAEDDPETLERFRTEGRIAATLRHPNICPVHDVGEIGGRPYLTMAFIPGRPLSNYARSKYRHPLRQVVKVVRKLAFALHAAHVAGIVHRDVKPANVMIDDGREPILMDFGLARKTDPAAVRLTRAGAVLGTPAYMSPEQVEGRIDEVGPASDQFSLGTVLYELLTGSLPFAGESLGSVMARILRESPPPPRTLRPEIDEALGAVCVRMLSKSADDRFPSLADVAEELGEWLRHDKARSTTDADTDASDSPSRSARLDASKDESSRNRAPVVKKPPVPARTRLVPRRPDTPVPTTTKADRTTRRGSRPADSSAWQWMAIGFGVLAAAFAAREFLRSSPEAPSTNGDRALRIQVDDPGVTVEIDGRKIEISDARGRRTSDSDESEDAPGTPPAVHRTLKPNAESPDP